MNPRKVPHACGPSESVIQEYCVRLECTFCKRAYCYRCKKLLWPEGQLVSGGLFLLWNESFGEVTHAIMHESCSQKHKEPLSLKEIHAEIINLEGVVDHK